MLKRPVTGLGVGLLAAALSLVLGQLEIVREFENGTYDWRVNWAASPASPDSPIVIVEINESTIRALEPVVGRWPWPRLVHGGAIDYLAGAGARVIAYDVLFGEREGRSEFFLDGRAVRAEDSDAALIDAVRNAGNVVLLADATFEGLASGSPLPSGAPAASLPGGGYEPGAGFQMRPALGLPFSQLAGAAAAVGHNLLVRDGQTDAARRMLPFVDTPAGAVPSLGMAAALAFAGIAADDVRLDGSALTLGPDRAMPLLAEPVKSATGEPTGSRQALLRFVRPVTGADGVRASFPTYSFFDVLLSQERLLEGRDPVLPPSVFAGKLVFVGTTAAGTYDRYGTPFPGGAAGVELHATLADNVLSGRFMRRLPRLAEAGLTMAAGLGAGLAATTLPVGWAMVVVGGLLAGLPLWLLRETGGGTWIGLVGPTTAAATALFLGVAWQYVVEGREKRHIRNLFGRYVSGDVIDQLLANPALAGLGGERREMTVLFSDIRGFTAATERAEPEAVVAQLNEYFGAMVEVLFRHQGTLDKFVGDMVMGLFGAPLADPRHADHAVEAAIAMRDALAALNVKWQAEGKPAVEIGIGINSGEMIAGNIGSEAIMSYTVIGDAVNLGARIEALNKDYGTQILISEGTRTRLTLPVATRAIGEVAVKGRTRPVLVYEVTHIREQP